jgi:hypothetical protein
VFFFYQCTYLSELPVDDDIEGEESPKGNDGDEYQVQPQHVHLKWKTQIINPLARL